MTLLKKTKRLLIPLILSILIINPLQGGCVEELDTLIFENPSDILKVVPAITVKLENHEGNQAIFGYEIIDEEQINGKDTWVVETEMSEGEEGGVFTLWVEKESGKAVQVEVEGQTHQDNMFIWPISNMTFGFFSAMIYESWKAWDYYALHDAPYGDVRIIGRSTETYGPTTLTVLKYEFTSSMSAPQEYKHDAEVWMAPTQFGGITTYLYLDSITGEDEWFSWEVQSIVLSESQQVPDDLPTEESEIEPEEEPGEETEEEEPETEEEEPEETSTEEEQETQSDSGGGIPGFPPVSMLSGAMLAILLIYFYSKRNY